ncbi:hypothetical protein QJS04_geneDACA014633 [Acorus gramineus]|uniref:Uncharacterized protein n=1 Tax=Acorus gramineus TaxID=55184 RepID=A0AAV9APB8_ACOGR|nr:hypothetical protein QJS04_geneDACA014633 [Acorus gramineus]
MHANVQYCIHWVCNRNHKYIRIIFLSSMNVHKQSFTESSKFLGSWFVCDCFS